MGEFGFLDFLDLALVGLLALLLYRWLRGTVAVPILLGMFLLYALWNVVGALHLTMLHKLLGKFIQVGVLIMVVIFQPEIRRFLLMLGTQSLSGRWRRVRRFFRKGRKYRTLVDLTIQELEEAITWLTVHRCGALLVVVRPGQSEPFTATGTRLDAQLHHELLISIFQKNGPLHDGAVVIQPGRVRAAGCVLPVSNQTELPREWGMRHRAGLGATEVIPVVTLVVSEETGQVAIAQAGRMKHAFVEGQWQKVVRKMLLDRNADE